MSAVRELLARLSAGEIDLDSALRQLTPQLEGALGDDLPPFDLLGVLLVGDGRDQVGMPVGPIPRACDPAAAAPAEAQLTAPAGLIPPQRRGLPQYNSMVGRNVIDCVERLEVQVRI